MFIQWIQKNLDKVLYLYHMKWYDIYYVFCILFNFVLNQARGKIKEKKKLGCYVKQLQSQKKTSLNP